MRTDASSHGSAPAMWHKFLASSNSEKLLRHDRWYLLHVPTNANLVYAEMQALITDAGTASR